MYIKIKILNLSLCYKVNEYSEYHFLVFLIHFFFLIKRKICFINSGSVYFRIFLLIICIMSSMCWLKFVLEIRHNKFEVFNKKKRYNPLYYMFHISMCNLKLVIYFFENIFLLFF